MSDISPSHNLVSVVDVGSNSVRLCIYALGSSARELCGQNVCELLSKKCMAGLASYVERDGSLSEQGIQSACEAIAYLHAITYHLGIRREYVFATASLRNITNTAAALDTIYRQTKIRPEIISADLEAKLGYLSLHHAQADASGVMADIGGGSTEIVNFEMGEYQHGVSIPLGSLKLFKTCVSDILPSEDEVKTMRGLIRETLDAALPASFVAGAVEGETLFAVGGSARAGRKLMRHTGKRDKKACDFSPAQLEGLINLLSSQNTDKHALAIKLILRYCPDRMHTLLPGIILLQEIASRFKTDKIRIVDANVREGYLLYHHIDA